MSTSLVQNRGVLFRLAILLATVLTVVTCHDLPFEPGMEISGSLDVRGLMETAENTPIPIDSLVIELRRTSDSAVVFSETVHVDSISVSADGDTVSVDIRVELSERTEEFYLYVAVVGDGEVWFEVHDVVTAEAGSEPTVTDPIQPVYVGPGANATSVSISLSDTTITGGDSILVTGTAYDSDTPVDGALVWFESSDTNAVPTPRQEGRNQAWVLAPVALTDSVTITGIAPTGDGTIATTGLLQFFARPNQLVSISGEDQEISASTAAAGPMVVQVLDAAGDPFTYGFPVAFSVASGPVGTTVNPDTVTTDVDGYAQATVTAGSTEGTIQIAVTAEGLSGSPVTFNATVLENQGPVASIAVTPDSAVVLTIGDSVQYTAVCQDTVAAPVSCGNLTWMSLAPAVATVGTDGYARSQGAGVAGIVASAGGVADTAQFVVNGIGTLTVSPTDTVITAIGDSLTLTVRGEMVLGGSVDIPTDSVVWQTLSPAVAIADSAGNVHIVGSGVATVRATLGTASGAATLRVLQAPASFAVLPNSPVIGVGGVTNLRGYTYDRNGYQVPGRSVGWTSRNTAVATVDATGRVSGVEIGATYVVGEDTDAGLADSAYVDVVEAPPAILQWGADSISVGRGATLQQAMLLSVPAPAQGVTVDVVSSDTMILKPTTPTVIFSSGQTSRTVTFEGRAAGRVTVSATDQAAGFAPDTLTVGVLSTMEFRNVSNPATRATSFSINSAESRRVLVFLSDPAPPGGLAVNVETSDDLVAVGVPSPATIPGGQLSVEVDLQGTGVGSATLTPSAAGWVGLSSTITTSLAQFSLYVSPPRVGAGQRTSIQLSVPNIMDRDLTVQTATTDPSVGSVVDTVIMAEGRYYTYFDYEALQPGLDTITANRSGWVEGRQPMLVTTPRVEPGTIYTQTAGGPAVSWTVYTQDSSGTSHGRIDTLTVTVTSRDPTVLAVDVPTALVTAGRSNVSASSALRPVGAGTTYLVASALGHLSDSVLITVNAPKLSMSLSGSSRSGTRQYETGSVYLPTAAAAPVTASLQSLDPAIATVTESVVFPTGSTRQTIWVDGQQPGTTSIIVTAVGYEPDTVNFTVTTNILSQSSLNSSYYITVGSDAFSVRTGDVYGTLHETLDTVLVTLETTDPAVFTIDSSTVTVADSTYNSTSARIQFQSAGQAYVRWSAPGYATDSMLVTINPSPITFYNAYNYRTAIGQYATRSVQIPSPNGLIDTTYIQFTHPGTARGSVPDTVQIAPGASATSFRWIGTAVGFDTITATATNFIDGTNSILVTRPWLFAYGLPSGVVVNDTFNLRVYSADSLAGTGSSPASYTTHPVADTLPFTAISTDSLVIAVDSTANWDIPAEAAYRNVRLIARGPGTAQIIVSAADPWKHDTTNVVVVTAPAITLTPASYTLGTGQQYQSYRATIPNGVADTTYVALAVSDTAVAGFSTDTVAIPPGSRYSPYVAVYAKNTVASVQLTATAQGFTQGTAVLIVNTPTFDVNTNTTGYVGGPSVTFTITAEDETGGSRYVWEDLSVSLSSTNPSVLTLDSSTVILPTTTSYTRATWTPGTTGSARIVATAPGYKPDTSDVITVEAPQITFSSVPVTLGVGQRNENARAYLPFTMSDNDTALVALSSSDLAVLSLSVDSAMILPGENSAYFNVVGIGLGTASVAATADGFADASLANVEVGTPMLYVNGPTTGTASETATIYVYTQDQSGTNRDVNQTETVTLTVSDPAVADFGGQASVTIDVLEGEYWLDSQPVLNFLSAGSVTVTATLSGYDAGVLAIEVSSP